MEWTVSALADIEGLRLPCCATLCLVGFRRKDVMPGAPLVRHCLVLGGPIGRCVVDYDHFSS